jgi:hypothetical protein
LGGYGVWLVFNDGSAGEADGDPRLHGAMFEPLRTKNISAK